MANAARFGSISVFDVVICGHLFREHKFYGQAIRRLIFAGHRLPPLPAFGAGKFEMHQRRDSFGGAGGQGALTLACKMKRQRHQTRGENEGKGCE